VWFGLSAAHDTTRFRASSAPVLELSPSTICFPGRYSLNFLFEKAMNVDIYVDEKLTAFAGIYCAHCGKTITEASNANLIFKESYANRFPVVKDGIHTVHKACDRPFTLLNPCAQNERYSWIQLDAALYMLLKNCHYKPSEGKRVAAIFAN
jgi:esterase/lipase superfamily enzyme